MKAADINIPKPKSIKTKSAVLGYREYGKGYPVICLPPWMNSSIAFAPFAETIKDEGINLIALDLPGWSDRSSLVTGTTDIDTYIHLVREFVEAKKLTKYSIIGYSFGGVIAQGSITVENLKPAHLILISSLNGGFDIFGSIRLKNTIKGLKKVQGRIANRRKLMRGYLFYRKMFISFATNTKPSDVEYIDMLLKDAGPISVPSALDSVYSLYGRSFLSNLLKEVDTKLIMAEKDHGIVKKGMRKIAKYLDMEITLIPGVNHHHFVFYPEKSREVILDALGN